MRPIPPSFIEMTMRALHPWEVQAGGFTAELHTERRSPTVGLILGLYAARRRLVGAEVDGITT